MGISRDPLEILKCHIIMELQLGLKMLVEVSSVDVISRAYICKGEVPLLDTSQVPLAISR